MTKHIIKISILLVWLGLMGWWWLESRTWPAPEKIDAAFLPDYNDYYSLSFGEQKVGWASKSLRRESDGGYQGLQTLNLTLAVEDQVVDLTFSVTAEFDRVMNLTGFRYLIQAGPVGVTESGQVSRPDRDCPAKPTEGLTPATGDQTPAAGDQAPPTASRPCVPGRADGSEGRLTVNVSLGEFGPTFQELVEEYRDLLGVYADKLDFSRPVELAIPAGPGLMQFIPPYLSYLGLNQGTNYSFNLLDPINRSLIPVTVRVEDRSREYDPETGQDIDIYRVRLSSAGGAGLQWLDRYGRTVREETLGFKLERVISLADKFDEPRLAAQGAVPLKPPPGLQNLFSGRDANRLLDRIQKLNPPRRPGGAQPEAPAQTDDPSSEFDGEESN